MDYQGNPFWRRGTETERIFEMAKAIAAIAALECADDAYEFGRIQRSILATLEQSFPHFFGTTKEEVD